MKINEILENILNDNLELNIEKLKNSENIIDLTLLDKIEFNMFLTEIHKEFGISTTKLESNDNFKTLDDIIKLIENEQDNSTES